MIVSWSVYQFTGYESNRIVILDNWRTGPEKRLISVCGLWLTSPFPQIEFVGAEFSFWNNTGLCFGAEHMMLVSSQFSSSRPVSWLSRRRSRKEDARAEMEDTQILMSFITFFTKLELSEFPNWDVAACWQWRAALQCNSQCSLSIFAVMKQQGMKRNECDFLAECGGRC